MEHIPGEGILLIKDGSGCSVCIELCQ